METNIHLSPICFFNALVTKRQYLFLAIIILHGVGMLHAQTFSSIDHKKIQARDIIAFTVGSEANIRYYCLEAANDTIHFEKIAKIQSLGNIVIPRSYRFDITGDTHQYFRITSVYMNWHTEQSAVIAVAGKDQNSLHALPPASPSSKLLTDNSENRK